MSQIGMNGSGLVEIVAWKLQNKTDLSQPQACVGDYDTSSNLAKDMWDIKAQYHITESKKSLRGTIMRKREILRKAK